VLDHGRVIRAKEVPHAFAPTRRIFLVPNPSIRLAAPFPKLPLGRADYVVGNTRLVGGRPDVIFDHTKPGAFIGRIRTRFKYFGNLKFFVQEFLEVIGSRRRGYGR
jgi:hypothetical protein